VDRAYSLFSIKSIDEDLRVIEGIASTPETDRQGDSMDPLGAKFSLPMPLLWQHKHDKPIGTVVSAKPTSQGIAITAQIAKGVLPFVDEAWTLIKARLVRGLSIDWLPLKASANPGSHGLRVKEWEWVGLSVVTLPANASATIQLVKSLDAEHAATGPTAQIPTPPPPSTTAGASAHMRVVVKTTTTHQDRSMKKTIADQIKDFENTRAQKAARLEEIQTKAVDEGRSKDEAEKQEFDTLKTELKSIDDEIADLNDLAKLQLQKAAPVVGGNPTEASQARGGFTHVSVQEAKLEPGIGFARYAIAKMASFIEMKSGNMKSAEQIAKERWPHDARLQRYMHAKATVAAGTTTDTNWATELVEPTTLEGEFVEYLRAMTVVNRLGLRRVPFNVRIPRQTTGGTGYWVGEGAPKPLTSFQFDAITVPYTKVAAIAVITQELARFSRPDAEAIVRDQLSAAIVERYDTDFLDPAKAVSSGVNPASITNGLTALSSAGTSADNIRTDIMNLLEYFILNNLNPANVKLVMPNTLALAASTLVTTTGSRQFPDLTMQGGSIMGIPVITSQYAASGATFGNMIVAIDTSNVALAQDPGVTVDVSGEASLQMLDNPTNNSATGTATTMVSMFQTNSLAIRAEQFIHWVKLRSTAVVFMDDVNWGAIGSPV
jgi:HK97 family phage major capsid protein/HK97 family phage prohead protease